MENDTRQYEKRHLKKMYFPFLNWSKVLICHSRDTNETFCSEKPSVAIILRLSEKWPQNDWTKHVYGPTQGFGKQNKILQYYTTRFARPVLALSLRRVGYFVFFFIMPPSRAYIKNQWWALKS